VDPKSDPIHDLNPVSYPAPNPDPHLDPGPYANSDPNPGPNPELNPNPNSDTNPVPKPDYNPNVKQKPNPHPSNQGIIAAIAVVVGPAGLVKNPTLCRLNAPYARRPAASVGGPGCAIATCRAAGRCPVLPPPRPLGQRSCF
jgi:hypothetical protein